MTKNTVSYLLGQIKAGAEVIQLFDSWSGILSGEEYVDFVIKPTKVIISALKGRFPTVPIIGFPRGSGFLYEKYYTETAVDGVSVDQFVPVDIIRKWQENILVQGNLDPFVLLGTKDIIKKKADEILSVLSKKNFIFNLGHGIHPLTPVENVEFLVNYVRNSTR